MDNDKFVANIVFRVKKIVESNPSFYSGKGNDEFDDVIKVLEAKKDSIDKIIDESQKIKKDIQERAESSKIKITELKQSLLESLGVSDANN